MESLSNKENVAESNISSGKNSTVKNILYKIEEGFCSEVGRAGLQEVCNGNAGAFYF